MRPEDTEGTGGNGLRVPMTWLVTEYMADELLRTGDLMEPGTPEFRAGRDALALTMFLCERPGETAALAVLPDARVEELRKLTAYACAWRGWICERLAEAGPRTGPEDPDPALARSAWRWLEETELPAADLDAIGPAPWAAAGPAGDQEVRVWTPAWQLGLPLAHLAVQLY
ncbi:hypothetical protein ACFV2V_13475 [Streptomyces sp. NPDC059698]|uniref:hypothetical protein n=1 Tax=unclassified Streptomyces TaxID=2593676 RepID=UPI00093D54EC|nr:hypothetical protein [Streptomyces sp. CB02366]OKJ34371.1 hypothetical protein AMK24_22830 [Streptomyces sp. CB02366]TVP37786.1 hypothetical protein A3L22_25430 [Streptomyces griseus subsp. griseus]WSS58949.1 hypothetical protein OG543_27965 [Streptomyces sp. NBC_01178]